MKLSILYRIAAILIFLFALGHTVGFRQSDPHWQVEALLASMRSIHFATQGFKRSYWDFFSGFGFFVSVFLFFAALLSWQLGGMVPADLRRLSSTRWTLAFCFVATTLLSCRYFFLAPILFSALISIALLAAAWMSPFTSSSPRNISSNRY